MEKNNTDKKDKFAEKKITTRVENYSQWYLAFVENFK